MVPDKYERYRTDLNFIKKYSKAVNAATGSEVDANSNVSNKNIATMATEIHKKANIYANRLAMHDKIKELYGEDMADEYIRQLENHEIYRHDESGTPIGTPYTYSGQEAVVVFIDNHPVLTSFERLYDCCTDPETMVDSENIVFQKYPNNMYIKDRNGLTKITALTKKKRHRDLVIVKTQYGENVIVTDNHPMIVSNDINDTVEAKDSLGQKQLRLDYSNMIDQNSIKRELSIATGEKYHYYTVYKHGNYHHTSFTNFKMDKNLGFFIGFFIAEGWFKQDERNGHVSMMIKVKGDEDLHRCADALYLSTGIPSTISNYVDLRGFKTLSVSHPDFVNFCLHTLDLGTRAPQKKLPKTIFEYGEDFMIGLLCGLVDGDGTSHHGRFLIRLSSRTCISQMATVLHYLGIPVSMSYQDMAGNENNMIQSCYPLFSVEFPSDERFSMSRKFTPDNMPKFSKYEPSGWVEINNVIPINNDYYLRDNDYIYDITTESHTFALNGLWMHNCVSITMYPFLLNGLSSLGGSSTAPKNLDSFCGGFCNLVFLIAAQFAGAVATPEWLAYMSYFLIREYGDDYYKRADEIVELGNYPRTIKDIVHAKFQQVVYTLNQPAAARGSQSVFWNVAVFDEPYFKSLFETFYFPDGTAMIDIWDSVNWLQKTFMKWLNHERTKKILTFPVLSVSLLNDGEKYVDQEMADWVAQMYSEGDSFFTYTSNSVDSLASCCYTDDTMVFVQLPPIDKEKEVFRVAVMTFAELEEDMKKHGYDIVGVWSRDRFAPGRLVHLPNRPVYKVTLESGEEIKMTDNHRNYIKGEEKPVLTKDLKVGQCMCLYNINTSPVSPTWSAISSIEPIDYDGDTYCFEMCDREDDMFTLANGVHNYNCRLKNEIHENTFSYTLGAGGVATGSKCVMTMNLNRLVQNVARANPEYVGDELFPLITEAVALQTEKIHKYLTAFNEILKEMLANHMLPVYEAEYITLEKQYLTVGTNGLNEAAEFLGIEISDNQLYRDFVEAVFRPISEIDKRDKTKEIMWNTEQVPAENLGVKNASYDKRDGYIVPRDCYNSYFFLSEDTTLSPMDKLKLHGSDYTKYLDGGSACHINLSEHLSKEQYKFIMQKAIEYGTPYFTFNIPNTVCRDCGHISKHYLDKCPKCGSDNVDYATRVIGYLTLISKWSVDRQKEGAKRYYAGADKVNVV